MNLLIQGFKMVLFNYKHMSNYDNEETSLLQARVKSIL